MAEVKPVDVAVIQRIFQQAGYRYIALFIDWIAEELARGPISVTLKLDPERVASEFFSQDWERATASLAIGDETKNPLEWFAELGGHITECPPEHLAALNRAAREALVLEEAMRVTERSWVVSPTKH